MYTEVYFSTHFRNVVETLLATTKNFRLESFAVGRISSDTYIVIKNPSGTQNCTYFKHRAVIRTSEELGNEKKNSRSHQDKLGPGGDGSHAA